MIDAIGNFLLAERHLFELTGTNVNSRWLAVDDPAVGVKQVRVLEAGPKDARPVLMIHGGNSVAAGWEPLLSGLQADFHLYAPDRPGCGLTDKLDYRGVRFREHGIAFVGAILDGLDLARATLIGNSMGSFWSLLYALLHPERVDRLVLIGEPAGSAPRAPRRLRLLGTPGINRLLCATVLRPRRARTRQQMRMLVATPQRIPEPFLDVVHASAMLPGAQLGWLSMLESVLPMGKAPQLTYALRPELPGLRCRTLFVWGDHDFCDPRWGKELCGLIPQADLELLPGAGHLAWLDSPEKVAGLVRTFLRA